MCLIAASVAQGENEHERKENQNLKKKPSSGKTRNVRNNKDDAWTTLPITYEGSSEDTILGSRAELLNPALESSRIFENLNNTDLGMPTRHHNGTKNFPEVQLGQKEELLPPFLHRNRDDIEELLDEICRNVIRDMNNFGVCVVDNFLGKERGEAVLREVLHMYSAGLFKDGQLVSNKASANDLKTIRGDQITWLDGKEQQCQNIGTLISRVDAIIMRANKMHNNGKIGNYTINGRTKVSTHSLSPPACCVESCVWILSDGHRDELLFISLGRPREIVERLMFSRTFIYSRDLHERYHLERRTHHALTA